MEQSARIITDSVGPNGARVTTVEVDQIRFCHPELLRHRMLSFSVASSRAIPYEKQRKQVAEDPMMPVLWPKHHKGMQGTEVFEYDENSYEGTDANQLDKYWLCARNDAIEKAEAMSKIGCSKQLTNRLLEPWVSTHCVITATNWDNFFILRHPWHEESLYGGSGGKVIIWEKDINLTFPTEYNLQDLAIKMKKAMNASTPNQLKEGEWHLPFITNEDWDVCHELYAGYEDKKETILDTVISMLLKVSAARSARTSYGSNMGKTVADDIKLADSLLESYHMSPFEHQAQAVDVGEGFLPEDLFKYNLVKNSIPKGMELRLDSEMNTSFWSGNFCGWIQNRKLLERSS